VCVCVCMCVRVSLLDLCGCYVVKIIEKYVR